MTFALGMLAGFALAMLAIFASAIAAMSLPDGDDLDFEMDAKSNPVRVHSRDRRRGPRT